MEEVVVIVGAGPSGIATSACLNLLSIPNIILEKEDCYASLWKKRSYDRLKLHLAKQFCHLPHMPHPPNTPTFIPRANFIQYIDQYVSNFNVNPLYNRSVESAEYDDIHGKWKIKVKKTDTGVDEIYVAKFLVVATGENCDAYIPKILGLETFKGELIHSSQYKSGEDYNGKNVLVVGCGNSGMEIAYDLSNYGASTSIVIRSPVHVVNKEMIYLGMLLSNMGVPIGLMDTIVAKLARFRYGNLTKYGIRRPTEGPFTQKATIGKAPVIDVGTVEKIKSGVIKVLPEILEVKDNNVTFQNGQLDKFDVIVFATGYRASNAWVEDNGYLLNNDGMPKNKYPTHWKGENGIYCAGFSRRGLAGVSMDAQAIAHDIKSVISSEKISGLSLKQIL